MPSSNHTEQAVGIIVWTRSEEKLVVRGARTAVEAELESLNFVDLYHLAARVARRSEKRARRRIERIDPTPGSVVADQNRVAHWTEISGSLRETPWRMKRAVRGEVRFHIGRRSSQRSPARSRRIGPTSRPTIRGSNGRTFPSPAPFPTFPASATAPILRNRSEGSLAAYRPGTNLGANGLRGNFAGSRLGGAGLAANNPARGYSAFGGNRGGRSGAFGGYRPGGSVRSRVRR
jgi:hypothetical protein